MTTEADIPRMALSIMQPWSWLIIEGHKNIENRDWPTRYRGPVAIHAGKKVDKDALIDLIGGEHPARGGRISTDLRQAVDTMGKLDVGGIVGVAEVIGCVENSASEWFVGRYGFVLRNARPVPFIPVKGALGFFDWRSNLPAMVSP